MPWTVRRSPTLIFLLIVSFLGLVFLEYLSIHAGSPYNLPWRKQLVSLLFGSLCVFAMAAVFHPRMCSEKALGRQPDMTGSELSSDRYTSILGLRLIHGHHPPHRGFIGHEFRLKSKTFCAGCFGILIGSLISLGGIIAYSAMQVDFTGVAHQMLGLGVIAVSISLVVALMIDGRPLLRILINFTFIVGMLLILIGVDSLTMNLIVGSYVILLNIFWMMTRILISRSNHQIIYSKQHQSQNPEGL